MCLIPGNQFPGVTFPSIATTAVGQTNTKLPKKLQSLKPFGKMPHRLPGVQESKHENKTNFNVYINQGEMYQIQEWVSKHRNIETGGDLFGLWLDDHTAVVQFVLGPGKKCRRTTTSFFQDVEYLQQAGSYLTDKHGLCNIGQWHSHHRLSLSKPSQGDKNTVWGNMPVLGLNRYVVFIANITNKVAVNCFLFHYQGRKRSLTKGQFKYLDGNSPLRLNEMVLQNTFGGLESFIHPAMFEREMKFLRYNDDNFKTSTGEKEQNVENEKSTSPKTTELKNLNDESEQPREAASFEREMKSGKLRPGLPGVQKSENKNKTTFNVHINEGEMHQIQEWVSKHQNIETGGDLFGLWLDDHTAVVQFVLGPGKKCRRTATSFFQDVEYLQQAGSYLTDKHGLCNIGQWHSHHRLSLSKPSDGDENTVWGNMPVLGLNRYIVFIANITNKVTVNCFLFHYQRRKRSITKGQFKYLDGNSPLRLNGMVLQNTFVGLESFIQPAMFEREMKLLRNSDDIIEKSTEDKEQNVQHEKSTSPKTTGLKNRSDGSEQPREAATFEREMKFLRTNDDIMKKSTGDQQKVEHGKSTTPKTTELKSPQEQLRETATFERRMKFLPDNDDNIETSTGNKEQNVVHEKSTTPETRELKNRNAESLQEQPRETARFEKDEQNVEHGCNTSFEPEQQNRNSLRGNNDAKDSNNILKDKKAKTYTENREKSNTNTSFEAFSVVDEQHGRDCLRPDNDKDDVSHENNNTYTGNAEQHDTIVSSHQGKPSRNSLQRNKDLKDKRDISNEENFGTYTENGELYDRSTRIQDSRHSSNSSQGYKCAKANNDILKDDKVKTSIRNTERYSTKNSVEYGHDDRNSFQRENEAKHSPDDLNKDYKEKFRRNNAKNSVTPGKDNKNYLDNGREKVVVKSGQMPVPQSVQRVTGHCTRSGQNVFQQQPSTPKKEQRASIPSECDSQQTTSQVKSKNTNEGNPKEPLTKLTVRHIQVAEKTPRTNYQDSEQSSQHHNQQQSPIPGYVQTNEGFSDTMRPAQDLQPKETRISQPTRSHQLPKSTSVHYLGNISNNKRQTTFSDATSIPTQRTPQKQKINGGDSEPVNDPSKKGGSTQHSDIKHNTEHYRSPNPEFKKVPQNEHQFKIEEMPNTRPGTKQPKEGHSEGAKNRKKEDKTKGKKTTGCLNCFGKKSKQVSDTAQTNNYDNYAVMYETEL